MFKRIDHVEIVTDNMERSVDFYTNVLGFKSTLSQQVELPDGGILHVAYLTLGNASVELLNYGSLPVAPEPQSEHLGYRMMALEVDDMDEALAHLKTKGVEACWGPRVTDRFSRAEIQDPNGFRIELRHWYQPPN